VIRAVRRQPFAWLWLTVAWTLMWGTVSAANVLAGMVVAAVMLAVLPMPRVVVGVRVHPWATLVLVLRFLVDVVVASFHVAWLAVRPGRPPRASVVTTRLRSGNELFQTLVSEMMSLVPGSLVVDLDPDSRALSMHVLDVETPEQADAFRRRVLDQERRVLAALAESPDGDVRDGGPS
jgi:multicomponent Na+:H+ antiporter subunit E